MQAAEFVSVYQNELTERQIYAGPYPEIMGEAREWSYTFGLMLHNRLQNPDTYPVNFTELAAEYTAWAHHAIPEVQMQLGTIATPDAFKAINEFNFHKLNYAMLACWAPVLFPNRSGAPSKQRRNTVNNSQNFIALNAIYHYGYRQRNISIQDDYPYYAPQHSEIRATNEGVLNELDTAIVALQIMRRYPTVTVVPAPAQFERGRQGAARYNADFIGISNEDEVIGIQTKSVVDDRTVSEYDERRIVLIDTKVDFGSTNVRRITPGSSKLSRVGWGGALSVSRVANIPTTGPDASQLRRFGISIRYIQQQKRLARELIGDTKPDFHRAVKIFGKRVLPRLAVYELNTA